jgi:putative peptidoglycan lipid II flippase
MGTPPTGWAGVAVTGSRAPITEPGALRQVGRGIGRAAILIGSLTVISRMIGFGRQLVFAHTVGNLCLGTAYATANQVPNIIYDIVLGGALTSAVVPVLAGAASRRLLSGDAAGEQVPGGGPAQAGGEHPVPADGGYAAQEAGGYAGPVAEGQAEPLGAPGVDADREAGMIASGLLTWTVVLLLPVTLALALAARPLAALLLAGAPGCDRAAMAGVSATMLAVFAPQILLYGLAVVLYGILQAHHRFTAPALAPVLSSLVVICAYLVFLPLGRTYRDNVADLPLSAELVLSVGTTAGVAALVLTALRPVLRLQLRLRPTLRFPPGVAKRARGLAAVGIFTLAAQDAALVAVILLANSHEGKGALVLYNYGWQMFFVPYAVLALPIATSAFPVLSAAGGNEELAFNRDAAASTRAVMLASWLGVALLVAAAAPAARLFVTDPFRARELAFVFAAFAPGLVGYGLSANLSRVLFARRRTRLAAIPLIGGWLLVIAADVAAVSAAPTGWVVPVLGLGNTVGLTVAGLALVGAVRMVRGPAALLGSGRAAGAGVVGGVAGAAIGLGVSAALPVTGFLPNAAVAALAALAATAVFVVMVFVLDGADLRFMASRIVGRSVR